MARWAEGFYDELNGHVFDLEKGGLRQDVFLPLSHHEITTHNQIILHRSPPASTRTSPSATYQDEDVRYAIGAPSKIRGGENITIGTRNTRTSRAAGKFQELTQEICQVQVEHPWIL